MIETIGRVHVRRWSAPEPARVVVLIHGYTEHAGRYAALAEALTARGSCVVAPDHVGHGLSAGERAVLADFEAVVDDIHVVVKHTRGTLPVVMVGHSMGGLLAVRYAQRYAAELAGLVLSAPAVGLSTFLEAVLALPAIPEAGFDGSLLSRDPSVGDDYQRDPLVWHGPWQRATLEAAWAADKAVTAGPHLATLPLLYLHGSDDRICSADAARPVIERLAGPDSEFRILLDHRHELFNEIGREALYAHVADFAERVAPAGRAR